MDFSLSSSLVGSAVLNADKLSLDLQFAADKTLTARKGPTPTFTRASTATVVGSNGLVRYAPNNSSLYSGQLVVGTGWSANATPSVTSIVDGLGPDGNNAYEIAEIANTGTHTLFNTGGAGITGATSVVSGTTYTGSIFVKKVAGSVDWIQLSFSSAGFGSVQYTNFNISNGTIGNSSSSSPQIQDAGNGWYRCSISAVATSTTTTTSNLFLAFTNNTDTTSRLLSYAGNTANKVLAAMCQFEIGSTVNTYNPTTTAAFQGPRFDHNPVTLACKGLLIEESRTNNSWYSGAIVNGTGWATSETTSVVDGVGPDGNNAYTITETTANTAHTLGNTGGATGSGATSTVNGTVYTGSIFLKKVTGSVDWIQVTLGSGGFGTAQYANFNINTGVVGNFAGLPAGVLPRIENYGNGWYRCSISPAATTTSSSSIGVLIAFTNNINVVNRLSPYIGNTNNKVLAAMCQFETGAFATSYIPTVASSVVRSADVCSITGSAFTGFYSINDGTLFSNCSVNNTTGTNRGIASIRSGATFFMRQSLANGSVRAEARANDTQSNIGTTSVSVLAAIKMALAYSGDDFASSTNGASPSLLTRTLPTGLNEFRIGSLDGTLCLNGHIDQIRYFRKRLDNAKLQALTV